MVCIGVAQHRDINGAVPQWDKSVHSSDGHNLIRPPVDEEIKPAGGTHQGGVSLAHVQEMELHLMFNTGKAEGP